LFRRDFVSGFTDTLHTQITLTAQTQHLAFLYVVHLHPAKALIAAAQATTAETALIGLANTAARAGYVKKLKLLRHTTSCVPAVFHTTLC
jgi:hypothetical protein